MTETLNLTAVNAAAAIRNGEISAVELVQACLDHIAGIEPTVGAWTHLDPDHALAQAREADQLKHRGLNTGALHGVPVGIKDIINTRDFPTEFGSPIHKGRRTSEDATLVARLRQAGAIILGKTVTTEFAVYHPGKTTNPHDPKRTPGGSSSGSAAAVAANMVPLAVGTQTNGSVLRPAAFCGVIGYKPTHGYISRHGVLRQSPPLDHVGVFAHTLDDVALAGQILMGYDANDPATMQRMTPALMAVSAQEPPVPPRFAFVKEPAWDRADETTRAAFAELMEILGDRVETVELGSTYNEILDWHRLMMEADLAKNFGADYDRAKDQFSPTLSEMIERGRTVKAVDYNLARERQDLFAAGIEPIIEEFDAIITPAAPGVAPMGLDKTGDPAFCTMATFMGTPAITVPVLRDEAGLPMGVQLISSRHDDARLLRNARWLTNTMNEAAA